MAKRKIIECDVCGNEIKTWEKIRIKNYYIGCSVDQYGIFPTNSKESKYIYICPSCIDKIKEYCRDKNG